MVNPHILVMNQAGIELNLKKQVIQSNERFVSYTFLLNLLLVYCGKYLEEVADSFMETKVQNNSHTQRERDSQELQS